MTDLWANERNLQELRHARSMLESNGTKAIPMLQKLASDGSVMSMLYLGNAYQRGVEGKPDRAQAEKWYRRAIGADADASHLAAFNLANLYFRDGNYKAAQALYEIGATADHLPSIYWLARSQLDNAGEVYNLGSVRDLLERAAARGHVGAKRRLSIMLMSKGIISSDFFRGLRMFLRLGPDVFSLTLRNPSSELLK